MPPSGRPSTLVTGGPISVAAILGVPTPVFLHEPHLEIAQRSRGTARIANRLLRRIRDFAQMEGDGTITREIADASLIRLDVDRLGLDEMDKRILRVMMEKFNGGPVGINTLAVAIGEQGETLEEIYEPYLIQEGLLQRTPRGRVATELAYRHFGIMKGKAFHQQKLF